VFMQDTQFDHERLFSLFPFTLCIFLLLYTSRGLFKCSLMTVYTVTVESVNSDSGIHPVCRTLLLEPAQSREIQHKIHTQRAPFLPPSSAQVHLARARASDTIRPVLPLLESVPSEPYQLRRRTSLSPLGT
jgi:hypothetical protein